MEQQDRPGWNPPPAQDAPMLSAPETVASTPRRSRIGTGVAVAAIAIGALGIAGTAYAANASNSPTSPSASGQPGSGQPGYGQPGFGGPANGTAPSGAPSGAPQGGMPGRHGDGGHGRGGMGGGMGFGLGKGLHGSFVIEKQDGVYQTIDTQRGTVTAVSKDSITVKSEDGFSATYVVTADTMVNAKRDGIASIKVGDEVGVMGVENAGKTTAVQIVDRTQIKDSKQKYAPAKPSAAPSSSSTA
jgi:hypothetical protein